MEVLRDGTFVFTIETDALARGLRPSKRVPRNAKFLVKCDGAVGLDGVLQVIDDLEDDRVDTSVEITDTFPYPQIFVLNNFILVCDETNIYEYDGASLTLVVGPVAAGDLWSVVEYFNFLYLTNGQVTIIRDPADSTYTTYAVSTDYPICQAVCDFNGQIVTGGLSD